MDDDKRNLIGSPARDKFKQWHKMRLDKTHYAADMDLVLVSKYPKGIVCLLDYKEPSDTITFTEVIAYNDYLEKGFEVYIVRSSHKTGFEQLSVYRYLGGNPDPFPPTWQQELVFKGDAAGFKQWENTLRKVWAAKRMTKRRME